MITYSHEFHLQNITPNDIYLYMVDVNEYATTGIGLGSLDGEGKFNTKNGKLIGNIIKTQKPKWGTILPIKANGMTIILFFCKVHWHTVCDKDTFFNMFKLFCSDLMKQNKTTYQNINIKIIPPYIDRYNVQLVVEQVDDIATNKNKNLNFIIYEK